MRFIPNILVILLFTLISNSIIAQNSFIESVKSEIKTVPTDSLYIFIDDKFDDLQHNAVNDSVLLDLLQFKVSVADSLNNRVEQILAYENILVIDENMSFRKRILIMNKVAGLNNAIGDTEEGMPIYFSAIEMCDSTRNDTLKATILRSLGLQYKNQQNPNLAIKYLNESLAIVSELNDSLSISKCYMTLGNAYKQLSPIDSSYLDTALYNYQKSITFAEKIDYVKGISGNYNNMANVFRRQGKFEKSLEFAFRALEINQRENNRLWVGYNYSVISETYKELGKYEVALNYCSKGLAIKLESNDLQTLSDGYRDMSVLQGELGDYKNAYDNLLTSFELQDSFENKQKMQLTYELEARFQNSKKESEILALKSQQSVQELIIEGQKKDLDYQEELRSKEKYLIYALAVILLSLVITMFVFWRNSKQRRKYTQSLKQKNSEIEDASVKIESAKAHLEEKNREITDSINYAKRIQAAILPSDKQLRDNLKESFVLYEPKDIVAGDFYWTEQVGDVVLFAVADCTGHGVPGAMVSVICHNALNACVERMQLIDPGKILDETTNLVLNQFENSESRVRDGMDIALCSFNIKTRELKYSGANMPLWIVRKGEVIKHKANRQPIGNYENRVTFNTTSIPLEKDDMLYLSTDGFADQFGGVKGKKFLSKRFRELLTEAAGKKIEHQHSLFSATFSKWKGELEQVDDVCILGARIEQ